FIIFDVEVAFFFPWAAVFGKVTQLTGDDTPVIAAQLDPGAPADQLSRVAVDRLYELGITDTAVPTLSDGDAKTLGVANDPAARNAAAVKQTARRMALTSFAD